MFKKRLIVVAISLLMISVFGLVYADTGGRVVGTKIKDYTIEKQDCARGGFTVPYKFASPDIAANLSSVTLNIAGSELTGDSNIIEFAMPYSGSVVAVAICSTVTVTGGIASADVTINGTKTGLIADIDQWVDTRVGVATQTRTADTFDAGDRIGVKISTDSSWSPTTADISVVVIVGQ